MQRCTQERLSNRWLMTSAGTTAGSLIRSYHCWDETIQPFQVAKELLCQWGRELGHSLVALSAAGSAFWKKSWMEPLASPLRTRIG